MFENILKFFKKMKKGEEKTINSKSAAKERLHLVLMQDRANVSADFLDLMRQEIIDVIKKYIEVDESAIDVRLTNKENEDGTNGAPALYANIPIVNIKNEARKVDTKKQEKNNTNEENDENKKASIIKEKEEVNSKEKLIDEKKQNESKENNDKKENKENRNDKEGKDSKSDEIIIDSVKEEKIKADIENNKDSKDNQKAE